MTNNINSMMLFLVEFGQPGLDRYFSINMPKPVFVLAADYNDACEKALAFAEDANSCQRSVVTYDGSLATNLDDDLKINNVKLVSDKIIM